MTGDYVSLRFVVIAPHTHFRVLVLLVEQELALYHPLLKFSLALIFKASKSLEDIQTTICTSRAGAAHPTATLHKTRFQYKNQVTFDALFTLRKDLGVGTINLFWKPYTWSSQKDPQGERSLYVPLPSIDLD